MKQAEDFIRELESCNALMNREMTFPEYASQLCEFQNAVCKLVAGPEYHDGMRIDEALFMMESEARRNNIRSNSVVHNGILTMKRLNKEIAVTMSGIKGENLVSRTLQFLNRPNTQIFQNVYLNDGQDETELDVVVLTDSGIIILEIKKVKSDITFTPDGRMVRNGDECFDKALLGDKMALKRRLLQKYLENAMAKAGLNIPVYVDSLIVLSAPKRQYVQVTDHYRKEKYCFRTSLNQRIEDYIGCAYYKEDQLAQLGMILSEMAANAKRFETELDYDEVRKSIAEALAIMQNEKEKKVAPEDVSNEIPVANTVPAAAKKLPDQDNQHRVRKTIGYRFAAATFAFVVLGSAAAMLGSAVRRM